MIKLNEFLVTEYFTYKGYIEVPHDGTFRCYEDARSGAKFWLRKDVVRVGPTIGEAVDFTPEMTINIEAWLVMQEIRGEAQKRTHTVTQQMYDWIDVREGRRTMADLLGWPGAPEYYDPMDDAPRY